MSGPRGRLLLLSLAVFMSVIRQAATPQAVLGQAAEGPIVVASKPFAESYILAEAFAQLLESHGYAVDRRPGLGMTEILMQALIAGDIDVYPEYTGTGLAAVLGETAAGDAVSVFNRVSEVFEARWDLRWLPPLGFENTYAMAMRREAADSLGLNSLSGLAAHAPGLAGGFSPDFIGRADGLDGLAAAYAIRFRETRSLMQAVKYQALAESAVDVIDAYSTDGAITRYDLAVLADDRGFFPPYDAAPLVGGTLYEDRPDAVLALSRLAGRIGVEAVRQANERLEVEGWPVADVAAALLAEIGLADAPAATADSAGQYDPSAAGTPSTVRGRRDRSLAGTLVALPGHMWDNRGDLVRQIVRHALLVLTSLGSAIIVAIPAGVMLERRRALAGSAIRLAGILQTIPGIALLAFMIPVLGIGVAPAVAALFLYSLLPILRNTYTGIIEAAPDAVAAGRALGMTELQLLQRIRLPLAAPVIMAGVRTAAVINVGTATLAAFIGAGGLGDPIVSGLALSDPVMILSGAVPAAALAVLADWALGGAEAVVAPRGVAEGRR